MKKTTLFSLALSGLLCGSTLAGDIGFSVGPGGVTIEAGQVGKLTLPPPKLLVEGGAPKGEEGVMEAVDEKTLKVKFAKAEATITVDATGQSITYAMTPQADVKSLRVLMIIPITFANGGKFSFGGKDLKPLPAEKGEQFVEQGGAAEFTLVNAAGAGITLKTPDTFQELADTRLFGMERFVYAIFLKAGTDDNKWTLRFGPAAAQ